MDEELDRLLRSTKCGVCVVPFDTKDAARRHYDGKIHAKKLERWKDIFKSKGDIRDESDEETRRERRREEKEERKRKEKEEEERRKKQKEERRRIEEEKAKEMAEKEALEKYALEEVKKIQEEREANDPELQKKKALEAAAGDIFSLAKKAKEAIYLKKGEEEERKMEELRKHREQREKEREEERERLRKERLSRDRDRDRDRYSRDRYSRDRGRDDRGSRGRDDRRSRDRDDRKSRGRSRSRDRKDRKSEPKLTKAEAREKYERELDEKLKAIDKKKQEEEEASIETWAERAKRKEKEAKEEERKKKEEERQARKEAERAQKAAEKAARGELEEGEADDSGEEPSWAERAMDNDKKHKKKKKKHKRGDNSDSDDERSRRKSKKRDRSRDRSRDRRSRSRDRRRRDRSYTPDRKRDRRSRDRDDRRSKNRQDDEDYNYNGDQGEAFAAPAAEDQSEYADLYAIPAEPSEPMRRAVKEDEGEAEVEENGEDEEKKKSVPDVPGVLDPRLIDTMDFATMQKILTGKTSLEEELANVNASTGDGKMEDGDEEADDPNDMSIPLEPGKLLRRCFNPVTGIGYCQICNKIFTTGKEANKHFNGEKHAAKVLIYQEQVLAEATRRAANAESAPTQQYYCELCESNCSSEKQMIQHLSGERHRTSVRLMETMLAGDIKLDEDLNPYTLPETWLRDRKHCNLCDVPIESIRIAKIHFNSRLHRQAAGLNVLPIHRETDFKSEGPHHCAMCNFRTMTEEAMEVHKSGVRHLENARTKDAVISKNLAWHPHTPTPPLPPKYSVVAEALPNEFGGPQGGMMGGMMGPRGPMGMMGPRGPMGMMGGPGMMGPGGMMGGPMGPGAMMGGPMMGPGMMGGPMGPRMMGGPMGPGGMMAGGPRPGMMGPQAMAGLGPNALMETFPQPDRSSQERTADNVTFKEYYCTICKKQCENDLDYDQHLKTEEHILNEANVETFHCRLCKVTVTSAEDFEMHEQTPKHIHNVELKNQRDHMRAMGQFVPDSEDEDEEEGQFLPMPLDEDGLKIRQRSHPWHCGICNSWFESISLLKFYHSVSDGHLAMAKSQEASGAFTCLICKATGTNAATMMEMCTLRQKQRIIGHNRAYSCDMCDVHLSEQEWLDNHNGGEKHRWTADRVEKNLPVQFQPVEMQVVNKNGFNAFSGMPEFWQEFRCIVCKVAFTPVERYNKHIGSLFHLRRCAGEDVKWIDGISN